MMKKAIGRILFTFSSVLAMVLVFGLQASNIHVYALSGGTRTLTYVSQKVEWTGFGSGSYTIEYGGTTSMFTSMPNKPSSGKVTVQVGANKTQNPKSRTGYIYAYQTVQGKKTRVATLTVVQNGHSHSYGDWRVRREATCTQDGVKYRTCAVCGKEDTAVIPHTNHLFQSWTVTKQPTCGAAGTETRTCKKCGAKETRSYGSATGRHTYGSWYVSRKPTCSVSGTETHKCTGCGRTETRSTGCYGHVYRQIERQNPALQTTGFKVRCERCGDTQYTITPGSDIIFCYERYGDTSSAYNDTKFLWFDFSTSLRKETDSFFEYKKNGGNYGVNTYLIYYARYSEYYNVWNNIIPEKVRNIYDYGHGLIGHHEYHNDDLDLVQVLYGYRQSLNKKKVSGSVYMFTCFAGSYLSGKDLNAVNFSRLPKPFRDGYFSASRYYAWVCPDADVISVWGSVDYDASISYYCDGIKYDLTLPSCSDVTDSYKFVVDSYNSSKDAFEKRMVLTKSILSTNFTEKYL